MLAPTPKMPIILENQLQSVWQKLVGDWPLKNGHYFLPGSMHHTVLQIVR